MSEQSLPFVVTGHTSSYKEEGRYPDVPDEIKNMDVNFEDFNINENSLVSLLIFEVSDSEKFQIKKLKQEDIKSFTFLDKSDN
jgi:hypothetical protein